MDKNIEIMDELLYDAIDMLKELIATPSISREESDAASIVESYIFKSGFEPKRSGNNVWCFSDDFDINRVTILLNSHIDTVKAVSGWSRDPFSPIIEDEKIYGLGSNDAGGALVSLFAAFRALNEKKQNFNLVFLASCEEEVGGKGGIESVIPLLPQFSVAIVGEPTQMQPAIAEKGLLVLDGEIKGQAGHAARNEGVNAIYKALPVIETLRNIEFEKCSQLLGQIKVTVTQITAGTQHNVVPDSCRIVVDVRTTDAYTNLETLDLLKLAVPDCTLTPRSTRLNSSKIDLNHPIVKRAITLGKNPFGSPTLSDQALIPTQSLKIGPGDSARSHTADEYITIPELRDAIQTYITLLDNLTL